MKFKFGILVGLLVCGQVVQAEEDNASPLLKIVHSQVNYQLNADGSYTKTEEQIIQPLTKEGVEMIASDSLGFSSKREQFTAIHAYTQKADGRKLMVSEDKIFTQEDPAAQGAPQYSDYKYRSFAYPDVEVGDQVVLQSTLKVTEGSFKNQFTETESVNPAVVVDLAEVSLSQPVSMPALKLDVRGWQAAKVIEKDGQRHYYWSYRQPKASQIHGDDYVSAMDYAPLIVMSSFADWKQLAAAYHQGSADKALPTESIRQLADKITAGKTKRDDQAKALYDWVRVNIRYVGIWLGNGGIVPHKAEDILQNRYGDCKDKATLLQALLAAKDIPSQQVLINLGSSFYRAKVANSVSFNHAILYVPELKTYLDATAELIPFGSLPFDDSGKPVLREDGTLATTPLTAAQSDALRISSNLELNSEGKWTGKTQIQALGSYNLALRGMVLGIDPHREDQFVKQHLRFGLQRGSGTLHKTDPYALNDSYQISSDYRLSNHMPMKQYGAFPVPAGFAAPTNLVDYLYLTEAPMRKLNRVCHPSSVVEETTIRLPDNLKVQFLPQDQDIARGRFHYMAKYQQQGNQIKVVRQALDTGKVGVCMPNEVAQLHEIAQVLSEDLNAQIGYQPVTQKQG
jgi:Transglutaminase-like enzymes, putative cysteine proteases